MRPHIHRIATMAIVGLLLAILPVVPSRAERAEPPPIPRPNTTYRLPPELHAPKHPSAPVQDCDTFDQKKLAAKGYKPVVCGRLLNSGNGSGEAASFDPPNLPLWCRGLPSSEMWAYQRYEACYRLDYRISVYSVSDGQLVFSGNATFAGHSFSSITSNLWGYHVSLTLTSVIYGNPLGLAVGQEYPGCFDSNGCTVQVDRSMAGLPLILDYPLEAAYFFTSPITQATIGEVANHNVALSWSITYPAAIPGGAIINGPYPRCDNAVPNYNFAGCTFPYKPTLTYSRALLPELANHIATAQGNGLPGSQDLPPREPLTRLTDTALRDMNRDAACPRAIPRPPGKECDEYPFASTWEGAYTDSLGLGYSIDFIDGRQNGAGGSMLQSFYIDQRVIEGDPFWVEIDP